MSRPISPSQSNRAISDQWHDLSVPSWQLLSLCRRRQSGQTLCQLLLQSSSFTLHSVSSYIRYILEEIISETFLDFSPLLLQAYFDDGKKSIKSDWRGFFFSEKFFLELLIGEAFLYDLRELKKQKRQAVCWAFVCDVLSFPREDSGRCSPTIAAKEKWSLLIEDVKKIVMMYCICLVM